MADYTSANGYAPAIYPPLHNLRQVLHPEYAILPHEQLCEVMENIYGPQAAERYDEYLEGMFDGIGSAFASAARDVGRFAARAAPVIATVGGGALQGALAGSSMGLPGIIAGAAAGGAGAGLNAYGSGTAKSIGGALTGLTGLAGQLTPMGRIGSTLGGAVSGLAGGGGMRNVGGAVSALGGMLGGRAGGVASAVGTLMGSGGGAGGGAGGAASAVGAIGSLMGSLAGPQGQQAQPGQQGQNRQHRRHGQHAPHRQHEHHPHHMRHPHQVQQPRHEGPADAGNGVAAALTNLFGGSSASGQLLSLLQRPETMQALAALNLGALGRQNIPLGSGRTSVPASAFANLIGELSSEACADASALRGDGESTLGYMADAEGDYVGDPSLARDRASRVWEMLNEAQAERVIGAITRLRHESADEHADEAYDEAADEAYEERAAEAYDEAYDESEENYYDAIDLADIYTLEGADEHYDEAYDESALLYESDERAWL